MIYKIADNILSPLGFNTEENYRAVRSGRTMLSLHENLWDIPEPFMASLFTEEMKRKIHESEATTFFEAALLYSIREALSQSKIEIERERVVFILSSTKGEVEELRSNTEECGELYLGSVAKRIGEKLGVKSSPIVICNACISGLSAIILAQRLLENGEYDYAIVSGCDIMNRFIVSGFQSFKVLSESECRPFDIERSGLNVGDAAATIILARKCLDLEKSEECREKNFGEKRIEGEYSEIKEESAGASAGEGEEGLWGIEAGAIRNDAHHISTPSNKGDGLCRAIMKVMEGKRISEFAMINAHGTGTLFNDQMEAVAIREAGLSELPINALKGYFGHTMGAAGILETILTMRAMDDGIILGTKGFEELGVSSKLNIRAEERVSDKKSFIKTLSGFGGCNAAILATKCSDAPSATDGERGGASGRRELHPLHNVKITPQGVWVDGEELKLAERKIYTETGPVAGTEPATTEASATETKSLNGAKFLTFLYKQFVNDYPKFYKMDMLSRLGFIATELLLQAENGATAPAGVTTPEATATAEPTSKAPATTAMPTQHESEERATILFNRSSSITADKHYLQSIEERDNYYPSPSLFVYTLPNIVTGEIAIRNNYHGESSFYILQEKREDVMNMILNSATIDNITSSIIGGWLDYEDDNHFEADINLYDL